MYRYTPSWAPHFLLHPLHPWADMKFVGFLVLGTFTSIWLFSCAFVITSIPLYVLFNISLPLKTLALYGLLRLVWTPKAWPAFRDYFAVQLEANPYFNTQRVVFQSDLAVPKLDGSTLMTIFPHGAMTTGWTVNLNVSRIIRGAEFELLVAPILLRTPFISEVLVWCSTGAASKRNMRELMSKGKNLALVPGGFEEAAIYRQHEYGVFIDKRKGFVKYALQYGYKISPAFTFGEESIYSAVTSAQRLRLALAKKQAPGILFWSSFGWLPDPDNDLVTVVGNPVQLPTIHHPTREQVDKYHNEVVVALHTLFETYKGEYARNPKAVLKIY
uniref:Acyltransferase n=1 Tax=Spongospora subterranea TaxID=70186 RepID=A0A0H5QNI8_9EUKA|eukprot:CRZ02951.1 hypothetical protein [Spongospora subterranea]